MRSSLRLLTGASVALGFAVPAVMFACGAVDLVVEKSGPSTIQQGQQIISYAITIRQLASGTAKKMVLRDTFPAGLTFTGFAATVNGVDCSVSGNIVTCEDFESDAFENGQVGITLFFSVPSTVACGPLVNTVTVTSADPDLNPIDNSTSFTTQVLCPSNTDLTITKSAPATVVKGGAIAYSIVVTNSGPAIASNVTVTDPLPAGTTFISGSANPGSACTVSNSTVTCPVGSLASGASSTITINVQTSEQTACGILTNRATVSGSPNSDTTNDSASVDTQVTCVPTNADIYVQKSGPATVQRGNAISYTLTVGNNGPAAAVNVVVTDNVPVGLTGITAVTDLGGSCSVTGQTVTCNYPTIAPNVFATITITAQTNAQTACATVRNTASVTTLTTENSTDKANNVAFVDTTVECPTSNLTIAKTASVTSVERGGQIEYTVTVTNSGPAAATNITVKDTLPAGLSSASISSVTQNGNCAVTGDLSQVSCTFASLASGASAVIKIKVTVASQTACGTLTKIAEITAGSPDSNTQDNSATATTNVVNCPAPGDVSVEKSGPSSVSQGGQIVYTLKAKNQTSTLATGVTVTDTLPANTTFVSGTWSGGSCTVSGQTVTCALGTLAGLEEKTITLTVQTSAAIACNILTNTATVTSTSSDSNSSNNTSSFQTTVINCPTTSTFDLRILKQGYSQVQQGQNILYAVTVTNDGPAQALNVVVTDPLPSGTSFVSAATTVGSCSANGSSVTCTIGTLAVNAQAMITLTARADTNAACTSVTNTATVASNPADSNTSNNSSSASTSITCLIVYNPPPPPPHYPPYQPPSYPPYPQPQYPQYPQISYAPPVYQQPPVSYAPPQVAFPVTGEHQGKLYASVYEQHVLTKPKRVSGDSDAGVVWILSLLPILASGFFCLRKFLPFA